MRIARLDLLAYGHFTDYALVFGDRPGLHLIYGDNESGKSTSLRALASVLFGYPHEVEDGFKHDAKDIAIGAELVAQDGRRLSFVRKRRGKATLADAAGAPLDPGAVATFLGGISKDVFVKVFGLDHRRLSGHAQALLADGGALGLTLAEAASGVAGLKAVIDRLKSQRAALFLPGGSKPSLNQLIARLTELRREAKNRTVTTAAYKRLEKEIAEVEERLQQARDRQGAIETQIRRLERVQRNLPRRAEHAALLHTLAQLADVPVLPPEAGQQRVKARTDLDTAAEAFGREETAIAELDRSIAAVVVDRALLARRGEIERLAKHRHVIENQQGDLPRRQAERRQHVAAARDLLAAAELAGDPENLVLPPGPKRQGIAALAVRGTTLIGQRDSAAAQLHEAEDALRAAEADAAAAPPPHDVAALMAAVSAGDKLGDIATEIARRSRAVERKSTVMRDTVVGLGVAGGEIAALRVLAVPSAATVQRCAETLKTIDSDIDRTVRDGARLDEEIATLAQQIRTRSQAGAIATVEDLVAARRARERSWAVLRGLYVDGREDFRQQASDLSPHRPIADTYQAQVAEADQIADVIRLHADEAAELSVLARNKAEREAGRTEAAQRAEQLRVRRDAMLAEWRALWPAGMITVELPADRLEWLARRAEVLSAAEELDEQRDEITSLAEKQAAAVTGLVSALHVLGVAAEPAEGIDALRSRARQLLDEARKGKAQYDAAQNAVRLQAGTRSRAEQAVARLDVQIAQWTADWRAALEGAGLRPDAGIETATAMLDIMNRLDVARTQIEDLGHRIQAMTDDWERFQAAALGLAALLPDADRHDPILASRSLEARLKGALNAQADLEALRAQRTIRAAALDDARGRREQAEAALRSLCAQAGCSAPDELVQIEEKSADKRGAQARLADLEQRLREDGGGLDLPSLFAECDGFSGDQIPPEVAALAAERETSTRRIEDLMARRAELKAEFERQLGQEQAADSLQAAAGVEAEIQALVDTYAELTLQETALRQAIDLYRDRNQGPILGRAKALFAELTNGAYQGLRADVDSKDQPILIAEHPLRGSLDLAALTDGTVDPLYLALRLAVIQEHNANHEPMPFIADDLLLNLDDTRARAAFRTLAHVAADGQVIFFTHHAHMIELARASVPPGLLFEHRLQAPDRRREAAA